MTDVAMISIDVEHGPRAQPAEDPVQPPPEDPVQAAIVQPAPAAAEDATGIAESAGVDHAVDLQRLWLSTQRRPWTSLALIPIGADVPTPRLAAALAEIGRQHLGDAVEVHDATSVSLSTLRAELGDIAERARCAGRAIVALPPLLGCPAGLAIARAADAVIVCIALGSSAIAEAEQILEEVGTDRVLGSVIFEGRKEKR